MNASRCLPLKSWHIIFSMLIIVSFQAVSSVTMTGSRIIYPEGQNGVNVELKNPDTIPYAVQGWFDSGDEKSTPQTGKAPFIASPMLFRVMPSSGQVMRVFFTGDSTKMPQDRESVYYFNFLQIPPSNAIQHTDNKQNKMLIMLKNRVKVFYRPKGILSELKSAPELIDVETISVNDGVKVQIKNGSAFHLSLVSVSLRDGKKESKYKANMIAPFSKAQIFFKNMSVTTKPITTIEYVNDQGARIKKEYAGK